MKKVIVTGGSGFIGSNLVNYLIKKRYFVINVDKLTYSSNKLKNKIRNNKNYKLIKLDINNKKRLIDVIKKNKPKAIFNLAAETHVDRSIDGPENFIHTNINGTFSLLESLRFLQRKKISPKLIHISTDEVYGDISKRFTI
jgi:dTDP-glucose 4,6-dehydratase